MRSIIIAATAALALAGCTSQAPEQESRPLGGVMPQGSAFDATTQVDCWRSGPGEMRCDAGVVRRGNGNATVTVFWNDDDRRVIEFEGGVPVSYDGGKSLRWDRSGDETTIEIGDEHFRIVDAIVWGG